MRAVLLALALLQPILDLDAGVQRAVQDGRRPWLEPVMRAATQLGEHDVVLAGLLAVALFAPLGPATVRGALVVLVPLNLVVEGTKRLTDRPRPDGTHQRSNASFPSSHAANAFALAAVFARRWPRPRLAFWLVAALVAASRVYLDRHYLSDVVVGAVLGLVVAWAVQRVLPNALAAPPAGVPAPPAAAAPG